MTVPALVPYAPEDAAGVVAVIAAVFDEYGMTFELGGWDADLQDVDRHYRDRGGAFWVLRTDARPDIRPVPGHGAHGTHVVGTVGVVPVSAEVCELKRLYLLPAYRGRGHGRELVQAVLDWARDRKHRAVVAWSDVRLETAHHVYRRLGFRSIGERTIDDPDQSRELGFELTLSPR